MVWEFNKLGAVVYVKGDVLEVNDLFAGFNCDT